MAGEGEDDVFSVSMLRPYETRLKVGGLSVGGSTMGGPISWMESIVGDWTDVEDTMMANLSPRVYSILLAMPCMIWCCRRLSGERKR